MKQYNSGSLAQVWLQSFESGEHLEDDLLYRIVYHSAPVLEQEKPAVILSFCNEKLRRFNDQWQETHRKIPISNKFRYYELRHTPGRTSVLFYHPGLLQKILNEKATRCYLLDCGYRPELTPETALADLKNRFVKECPHEIGIFLGIPLPDVLGFIKKQGKEALADGYWKVYHDVGLKLAIFARYREAKNSFIRFIKAGNQPGKYLLCKSM